MTAKVRNYYCEMCDKSFRTDDDLYMHEAEHETCGEEGCEFTAHPKIIEKHIKMQHETGLYSRIGKLYSQEDITKWIEERKKRYPSRKVIEEKKALEQKKIERGERIKPDTNKFNKSFTQKSKTDNFKSKTRENKPINKKKERQPKRKPAVVLQPADENADWRGNIPPFTGIGKSSKPEAKIEPELEETEDNKNFSDDEWEEVKEEPKIDEPPVPEINDTISNKISNNSLNLLACYNSDDELSDSSNGSAPEEVKTVTNKLVTNEDDKKVPNENEVVTNENENVTSEKEVVANENNGTSNENLEASHENKISGRRKRRHNRGGKGNKLDRKSKFKRPRNEKTETNDQFNNVQQRSLTLLEKLLSNEIRHERNVILQCVRYTVQNNFFQK